MALCKRLLLPQCFTLPIPAPTTANVAVQWNFLVSQFVCTHNMQPTQSNVFYLRVVLFHLALHDTGACTTEAAVVAYASRALLAAYLPLEEDNNIDSFLDAQLQTLQLTLSQEKLALRLGEALALDVVERRANNPRRAFTYGATRAAVDARKHNNTPGLFRFLDYKANKSLIIPRAALGQTFVLPNALADIEEKFATLQASQSAVW